MQKKPLVVLVAAALLSVCGAATAATGPSTTTTPYLTPVAPGVEFTSVLTVGDTVKLKHKGNESYKMVGIPDGLGAYDNGDGTITVLMNHELGNTLGAVRTHGAKGAFVSKWQIRKSDLKVLNGEDLIREVVVQDPARTALNRLCSADLPAVSAFFNSQTGKGFSEGRVFMSGEESGPTGRAFAHIAAGRQHGTSYELPAIGNSSWENLVASPFEQDKTIVAALDDGDLLASKVVIYVGEKQEQGNPVELAGLTNGTAFQVKIGDIANESGIANGYVGNFSLVTSGGTGLNRVEDGAWDPLNPNRFYFVTTDKYNGNSRLWRLTFNDITEPTAGGKVEILLDGGASTPKVQMMDNMTLDNAGNVYIQEDVGNNAHLGKIWKFGADGSLTLVAQHDRERFGDLDKAATAPFNKDEESSGILEVTDLFKGVEGYDTEANRYFLLDVQAHYATDAETVQGGQLLLMKSPR